ATTRACIGATNPCRKSTGRRSHWSATGTARTRTTFTLPTRSSPTPTRRPSSCTTVPSFPARESAGAPVPTLTTPGGNTRTAKRCRELLSADRLEASIAWIMRLPRRELQTHDRHDQQDQEREPRGACWFFQEHDAQERRSRGANADPHGISGSDWQRAH